MKNLDDINNAMCLAKWVEGTLYISSGMTHSCHLVKRERAPTSLVIKDPAAIFNTPSKKYERKLMIEGVKNLQCLSCIKFEDSGGISDRMFKNDSYFDHKDSVLKAGYKENYKPVRLEIGFDNTCNLKCMYCNPAVSSSIKSEIMQYGPYPDGHALITGLTSNEEKEIYTKAFWEWFPTIYDGLEDLRITGGEPFLSKQMSPMFDYIIKNPNPNLSLSINSNLSISKELIKPHMEKISEMLDRNVIKNLRMFTSIESTEKRAEYIRYGLNYDLWKSNFISILENYKNVEILIMSTYNVLSVTSYDSMLEFVEELKGKYKNYRVTVDPVQMKNPTFLTIDILYDRPDLLKYIEKSTERILEKDCYSKLEKLRMERMYQVSKNLKNNNIITKRKNFVEFINEYDRRKKTDFISTFPEMESFYYDCFKSKR